VITVHHLTKRFGRHAAVDDLTFEVRPGEVLGFLGPNGAGKTTAMRMITGYLPPSEGRVSLGGFDLLEHPLEVKRRIGYLPENPPLYPELTVRRYLEFVADIKDVPAGRRTAQVNRAIERAVLGEVRDTRIAKLSKGFKQRVGLAQAIVHEPPVLILDEPTSSLDPKQRAEVRELIAELRGDHTVVLSTHILSEASQIADRVIILNRGKVMAVDTPARLGERLRGREIVTAEIQLPQDGAAPEAGAVRAAIESIGGVRQVAIEAAAGQPLQVRVESDAGTDVRGDVAAMVAARGWRLLGLHVESLSLEDIFLKLTEDGD
jgi:ABC-2 type transport system ATP-binding protein